MFCVDNDDDDYDMTSWWKKMILIVAAATWHVLSEERLDITKNDWNETRRKS